MSSMALLGPSELGARAPAARFGNALVMLTYLFGARILGRRAGRLAAMRPLLTSPSIARGVYFYLHLPISVLATRPRPFKRIVWIPAP